MLYTHHRQSTYKSQTVLDSNFSTINPNNLVLMVRIKMLALLSAHELTIILCETIFRNIVYSLRYTHASKHFYGQTNTLVKASLDKELQSTNGKDSWITKDTSHWTTYQKPAKIMIHQWLFISNYNKPTRKYLQPMCINKRSVINNDMHSPPTHSCCYWCNTYFFGHSVYCWHPLKSTSKMLLPLSLHTPLHYCHLWWKRKLLPV